MSTKGIVVIIVLVLIGLAILGWKKGWFKKKEASTSTPGGRKLTPEENVVEYGKCTAELNAKSDAQLVDFISMNARLDRGTLVPLSRARLIHIATGVCAVDFPATAGAV